MISEAVMPAIKEIKLTLVELEKVTINIICLVSLINLEIWDVKMDVLGVIRLWLKKWIITLGYEKRTHAQNNIWKLSWFFIVRALIEYFGLYIFLWYVVKRIRSSLPLTRRKTETSQNIRDQSRRRSIFYHYASFPPTQSNKISNKNSVNSANWILSSLRKVTTMNIPLPLLSSKKEKMPVRPSKSKKKCYIDWTTQVSMAKRWK